MVTRPSARGSFIGRSALSRHLFLSPVTSSLSDLNRAINYLRKRKNLTPAQSQKLAAFRKRRTALVRSK